MDQHQADNCACHKHTSSVTQTLSELDFDRGIWNAAIYNDVERVRKLIKDGKTMDRDDCDYTALHYVARKGSKEIAELLINVGHADVNALTKGGATPLHRAAMMGNMEMTKLLIANNAKLNVQDSDGKTPLHRAAAHAHYEICKLLLEKQPDLKYIKDNKEAMPLDCLPDNANTELRELLSA